jgi:hypothetical protein
MIAVTMDSKTLYSSNFPNLYILVNIFLLMSLSCTLGIFPVKKNANQPKVLLMNCQYPFENHFFQ